MLVTKTFPVALILLLLPAALSLQPDNPSFTDEDGYPCSEWVGYDCHTASQDFGYSAT